MARPEVTGGKLSDDKLTLSVPEAGRLIGLGRNAAYDAAAKGELPTIKIGSRILVPKVALERMLESAGQAKAR